jgi:uracil-DNA glycosylase family 4
MSALTELSLQIQNCQMCVLHKSRTRAVPGEGAEDTTILFVGEAPGWHEDQQGKPFVGPAGHFLEELLGSISLKRQQVFIANVLKCRPPGNRDPLPGEIQACWPWLERQIQILQPKMIVSLGRYSMARFFPNGSISKLHGTARRQDGVIYFAMYHPAAALHQQKLRDTIKEDMLKIPKVLLETEKPVETEKQAEQLSLF